MPVTWLRSLGDLVLPRICAGCERVGTWWCATCSVALAGEPHRLSLAGPPDLPVHALASYRGAAGRALVAAKERGVVAVVPHLGEALARSVLAACAPGPTSAQAGPVVLVPAPSRPAAVRARGADVVADLASTCADQLRTRHRIDAVVVRCLVHVRAVADQAALDADERSANLAGALRVRTVAAPLLTGRTVVLVDDVVTTGATLLEAARAVRASSAPRGGAPVGAATVAAAGRFRAPIEGGSCERVVAPAEDG